MTPAIDFFANDSTASAAWRATPDQARANCDSNRLILAHYHDPLVTRREKVATTDGSAYVVASSRARGRTTAFSNGRLTHDGPTLPGMLHIAQPGDVVRGILERVADAYYLHIPVEAWSCFHEELENSSSRTPVLRAVHFERDHQLQALLQTIEFEATTQQPIGRLYLEGLSLSVMALLTKRYSSNSGSAAPSVRSGMGPKQTKQVREYMHSNLEQPISLAQLAAVAGYSRMHFAAMFRMTTGLRPHEYLMHARVERARSLLANSSLTIAQIAVAVGFSNQSHLTSVFRKIVGVTPARWREVEGRRSSDPR